MVRCLTVDLLVALVQRVLDGLPIDAAEEDLHGPLEHPVGLLEHGVEVVEHLRQGIAAAPGSQQFS